MIFAQNKARKMLINNKQYTNNINIGHWNANGIKNK